MNKRQREKRHNALKRGIRRLHDDVSASEGFPRSTDLEIERIVSKIGTSRRATKQAIDSARRYAKRQQGR